MRSTEDANHNGILDYGEDIGLQKKKCMLKGTETIEIYGVNDNRLTEENGIIDGSSRYHAYSLDNNGLIDDDDFRCYQAEYTWRAGSMNRNDWGNPGMNHGTIDKWDD